MMLNSVHVQIISKQCHQKLYRNITENMAYLGILHGQGTPNVETT